MVLKAIEKHGRIDVPLPSGPPFFRFSDSHESERALLDAGFVEPRIEEISQTLRIRAPETPFDVLMRGGVRIAAILKAQSPEALASIQKAVSDDAAPYTDNGEIRVLMPCVLASTRKP
jgi:hypothetical protein